MEDTKRTTLDGICDPVETSKIRIARVARHRGSHKDQFVRQQGVPDRGLYAARQLGTHQTKL